MITQQSNHSLIIAISHILIIMNTMTIYQHNVLYREGGIVSKKQKI
jgi:hypothetical protein